MLEAEEVWELLTCCGMLMCGEGAGMHPPHLVPQTEADHRSLRLGETFGKDAPSRDGACGVTAGATGWVLAAASPSWGLAVAAAVSRSRAGVTAAGAQLAQAVTLARSRCRLPSQRHRGARG